MKNRFHSKQVHLQIFKKNFCHFQIIWLYSDSRPLKSYTNRTLAKINCHNMSIVSKLMNFLQRWIFALKIKSWPKLFVPFILGQSFGISTTNQINWWAMILGFLFTFSLVSFIVLLNDYAMIR